MTDRDAQKKENIHYAFQENLERLMNVDRLRVSIYSFYAVVSGGLLAALMTKNWNFRVGVWVFLFLFLVSLITLVINWRIRGHVTELTKMLKKIAIDMGIEDYYTDGASQNTCFTLRNIYVFIPGFGALSFLILFFVQLTMLFTH